MRVLFHLMLLLSFSFAALSQDSSKTAAADTSVKNFFRMFHWKETKKGEFEITVSGYDSIRMRNNDFQDFYYSTIDKPDGKLTVLNEDGKKVRECVYKNKLMFDEHWWFSSGEKEFDGTWSATVNEFGNQQLTEYTWYYKNKKVRKHGYNTGITSTYYDSGILESEKTFENGKANGPFKEYFPNGILQTAGQYFDGNKTGEWIHYNMDGSVLEREH